MPTRTVSYEGFIDQDIWERHDEAQRQQLVENRYEDMARALARRILDEQLARVTMEGPTAARRAVRLTMSVKVKHQTAQHWLTAEEVSTAPQQSFQLRDQYSFAGTLFSGRADNRGSDVRLLGQPGPALSDEPLDGNDRRTATDVAIDCWQSRQYVLPDRIVGRTASQITIDDPMLPSGAELAPGLNASLTESVRAGGYELPNQPVVTGGPATTVRAGSRVLSGVRSVPGCDCAQCGELRRAGR